jgi:hypothetical protein
MNRHVCPKCLKGFDCSMGSLATHTRWCGVDRASLFWAKVNKQGSGGCWIWTGSIKPRNGYGHFRSAGRDYNAHRWAYEDCVGPIPEGMEIAHRCDVPACVNPEHLFVATHAENMADAKQKLRHIHGVRIKHAKLTDQAVREIRRDYLRLARNKSNAKELAARYGVGCGQISGIIAGRIWRHVK